MRQLLAVAALAASVLSVTGFATAATVQSGTEVAGTVSTSINTANAYVGEPVTLTHVQGPGYSGARMYGSVTQVVRAGQGRKAELQMHFTKLLMPSGQTYAVNGVVSGMQANTKNNALKEAGGALAGMLVGNMIGKTVFHTSIGGILGVAGGYLIARNSRENMVVPAGSTVRVAIRSARRQAG